MTQDTPNVRPDTDASSKGRELLAFLLLTVCLAPIASVIIVGSYGFIIWMTQLIAGPPVS